MVSIKDIAKLTNCHVSTVSRALRMPGRVNEKTRERILKAAKELGYRTNYMGQGLVRKKTYSIGRLFFSQKGFSAGYKIYNGITEKAAELGYRVFSFDLECDDATLKGYLELLLELRVEGIIICGFIRRTKIDFFRELIESAIPLVTCLSPLENIDCVRYNIEKGAFMATEHLIGNGHSKIGLICESGPSEYSPMKQAGYRKALDLNRIDIDERLVIKKENSVMGGYTAMKELLAQNSGLTAVLAGTDYMAIGAMRILREKGIDIPGDISVAGFDNNESIHQFAYTPLTSVDPSQYEIGKKAAELLVDIINGKKAKGETGIISIDPKLFVRDSSAKIL